jgi:PHD/YefM family antitoxin component YafN of YafNO toxin-antitoxin module
MGVLGNKGESVEAVVDHVLATRERVFIERDDVAAAVIMAARELEGRDYTIAMLSEPRTVRRILDAENALQGGDMLMGDDLAKLDPDGRYLVRAVTRGASLVTTAHLGGDSRWGLVASAPAHKALEGLQPHIADAVRKFMFGELINDPAAKGVELYGFLARRLATRVETALIIFRLDSVKRIVRVVEILNIGGEVGRYDSRRW